MRRLGLIGLFVMIAMVGSACMATVGEEGKETTQNDSHNQRTEGMPQERPDDHKDDFVSQEPEESATQPEREHTESETGDEEVAEKADEEAYETLKSQYDITDPTSIAVLVNKEYGLPEDYEPDDLVKPDIPFVYEYEEVHFLREEAAEALVQMFEASKKDGIELAGVSGYRSHAIQKTLYENYVNRDGEEAANRYSAKPGHSEHSTGLAMDVAGISGSCAANNCFADTEEAAWIAEHAHEFGFIIRYPQGKEAITGYQYEPWHLRYVGKELATILKENEWTMEEFFLDVDIPDEQP